MFVLNYLYFLILTLMLLSCLNRKGKALNSPWIERRKLRFTGPELFWTLLFSTGMLSLSAPAGLDLMALRLFSLEVACLLCLCIAKGRAAFPLSALCYTAFLVWLIVGLFYTPSVPYGVRVLLKYLYPFLVMLTASAVVRDPEVFLKASLGARMVALVSIIVSFSFVEHLLFPGVFWYATARAINYISICMLSLALFCCAGRRRKDLLYAGLFALPCLLWVFRTSIMGTVAGLMCFSLFKYKLRSLPFIAAAFLLGVAAVFCIPAVNRKMFNKESVTMQDFFEGRLSKDDINSNARFAMWQYFENKFYRGRELQGSGTGTTQQHFYTHHLFGGLRVLHSDIEQMKCDNGLIGLTLYYLSITLIIGHCFLVFTGNRRRWIKVCALTAGSSMAGVAVTLYADNVVNYSMCTLAYPFGFYGMMLGLLKGQRQQKFLP